MLLNELEPCTVLSLCSAAPREFQSTRQPSRISLILCVSTSSAPCFWHGTLPRPSAIRMRRLCSFPQCRRWACFRAALVYAAPKAALTHTARILAKQWKIRVNIVAPGVNDAGMAKESVKSGKYDPFIEKKVIPRFGRPEDVARAILFFLQPDSYVTGQVLTVDGGLTLKM